MVNETQKLLAQTVGVVLTLVGVAGFFVTDTLLIFGINPLHNVVHLASGVLGLVAGFYAAGKFSVDFNKWFGVVYLLVALLGFVGVGFVVNLLNINMADNWLHLALGLGLAGVGFGVGE